MTISPERKNVFHLDSTDPELPQHLYETLDQLAQQCPVAWSPALDGFWALTRYDDIVNVSQDWQTFTVTKGIMLPPSGASVPVIPLELDPPRHTQLRKLVLPSFTDKGLERWTPELNALIERSFAGVLDKGHADLLTDVFTPIPVLAICTIMGIDTDWRRIRDLAANFLAAGRDKTLARIRARELEEFLEEEIAARRGKPVTDLLGSYVNATLDGEPISDAEVLGLVQLMTVAGHETTVTSMGNMAFRLMSEPGLRERVLADRSIIPRIVDETLRLHPPAWAMVRTVTSETELHGERMCPGERVMMIYSAANRDPRKYQRPTVFDVERAGLSQHLTFGTGRHRCIGEALAKLELRLTLTYLLDHMPDVALAGEVTWGGGTNTHGVRSLPVTFTPVPQANCEQVGQRLFPGP